MLIHFKDGQKPLLQHRQLSSCNRDWWPGNIDHLTICTRGWPTPALTHHDLSDVQFLCSTNKEKFCQIKLYHNAFILLRFYYYTMTESYLGSSPCGSVG